MVFFREGLHSARVCYVLLHVRTLCLGAYDPDVQTWDEGYEFKLQREKSHQDKEQDPFFVKNSDPQPKSAQACMFRLTVRVFSLGFRLSGLCSLCLASPTSMGSDCKALLGHLRVQPSFTTPGTRTQKKLQPCRLTDTSEPNRSQEIDSPKMGALNYRAIQGQDFELNLNPKLKPFKP